jgi:para-aminobenzoate synthetase component 1
MIYHVPLHHLPEDFISQALRWASSFSHCIFLNPNQYQGLYPAAPFPKMLAAGAKRLLRADSNAFEALADFHRQKASWLFGYLSYDLKNELEALQSRQTDGLAFPLLSFFEPEHRLHWQTDSLLVESDLPWEQLCEAIEGHQEDVNNYTEPLHWQADVPEAAYIRRVEALKEHIIEGDIYEVNYCIEFFAEQARLAPLPLYERLNALSPMPFSAYLQMAEHYALCASPERFLKKEGQALLSQPIKGTMRRSALADEDEQLKTKLQSSEKERAENMMIVDLVRNDLARCSETGSVQVPEIFGIYTFPQVHQMISTVQSRLRQGLSWVEALRATFPMGSMTGAPKIKAMQLIEQYEQSRRGLYSGAIGYVSPEGDFDFNVVIRTLLYNAARRYASFQVGSAITYDAQAAEEYAECLLKASALRQVLGIVQG